jgi:hypothetical protein
MPTDARPSLPAARKAEIAQILPAALDRGRQRPKGYGGWPVAKRLEWTFQCSVDDIEEIVNLRLDALTADPVAYRAYVEVVLAVYRSGMQHGLQRARAEDQRSLAELNRRLKAAEGERSSGADGSAQG